MTIVLRTTPFTAFVIVIVILSVWLFIGLLVDPVAFGQAGQAMTRYISDALETPLRSGASTRHRVIRMVRGGDPVQVLRAEETDEYTLVRTQDGIQGWILTRHLMETPSPRQVLADALADNTKLKERVEALTTAQAALQTDLTRLTQDNQRLIQEVAQLRKVARGELALDEQNKILQQRVVDLEREQQLIQQEKQAMQHNSNNLFLLGAGVLLSGILIGIWIGRLPPRRRSTWDRI